MSTRINVTPKAAAIREVAIPLPVGFDWPTILAGLELRAVDGIEYVKDGIYRRSFRWHGSAGVVSISLDANIRALQVISSIDTDTSALAARIRRMFDFDADIAIIGAHLESDSFLSPLVAVWPSLRIPGGWDGFEVAARSIIGQQVSMSRARILSARLAERCGDALGTADDALRYLFPTPDQIIAADLPEMGMPGARVQTLKAMAAAALADPDLFTRKASIEQTVIALRAIKGIGDWTAHYIAMRACGDPDAFPHGDAGLLRGAKDARGEKPTPAELLLRAETWRPYRAYAAQYLWTRDLYKPFCDLPN